MLVSTNVEHCKQEIEISSQNGEHSSNDSFSHNSADPASVAIEEGTSTDSDVNDSAIEHSYSPTPEREEIDRVSALDQLSAASTAWASSSSSSYFFGFLTPRSSNNQDGELISRTGPSLNHNTPKSCIYFTHAFGRVIDYLILLGM